MPRLDLTEPLPGFVFRIRGEVAQLRTIRAEYFGDAAGGAAFADRGAAGYVFARMLLRRLNRLRRDLAPVHALIVDDADQQIDALLRDVGAFKQAVEIFDVGGAYMACNFHGEQVRPSAVDPAYAGWVVHRGHDGISILLAFTPSADGTLRVTCGNYTGAERFFLEAAMPASLSVNLNAVALLRNRRDLPWPSVTALGRLALGAGAAGLTVHPRPDQRHVRFTDLPELRALIDDEFPHAEFNIEGYPTGDFLALVEANEPEQVTLVPDDPEQPTSDHGWDFVANREMLVAIVKRLKKRGSRVSLFCDPDASAAQIEAAAATGADRVELYTGPYGGCHDDSEKAAIELEKLGKTADAAIAVGLGVNAGHDLTVANLPALCRRIPQLAEVSIGHGLTADALEYGMSGTVGRFLNALGGH